MVSSALVDALILQVEPSERTPLAIGGFVCALARRTRVSLLPNVRALGIGAATMLPWCRTGDFRSAFGVPYRGDVAWPQSLRVDRVQDFPDRAC